MAIWVPIAFLFAYLLLGGILLLALSAGDRSLRPDADLWGVFQVALWPAVVGAWLLFRRPAPVEPGHPCVQTEAELVGRTGVATSALRPWGTVAVAGLRYEARAQDGYIDAGARVEVVGRESQGLVVRASPERRCP